jgi:hypothetical protein
MTEDAVLILGLALVASTALTTLALGNWRRGRLAEFALRERERTLLRLTERFGTADEFVEFARSKEAEALFATMDSPAAIADALEAKVPMEPRELDPEVERVAREALGM